MKADYIRLRISELEKEAVKQRAEEKQMSMSEYILSLIRKDLDKGSR